MITTLTELPPHHLPGPHRLLDCSPDKGLSLLAVQAGVEDVVVLVVVASEVCCVAAKIFAGIELNKKDQQTKLHNRF